MCMLLRTLTVPVVCSILLTAANQLPARSFSDILVFGDSFSDAGNVFAATGGWIPPDPPYFQGRFSDGPVWVERLAEKLGLELVPNGGDPRVVRGNDFAAGGARAGIDVPVFLLGTIPSVSTQVQNYLAASTAPAPGALCVIFGGHNDVLEAADANAALDNSARTRIVREAAEAIGNAASMLAESGVQEFLVPNVADLGLTPRARKVDNNVGLASDLSTQFNEAIETVLMNLETRMDVHIHRLDVFALANDIARDAEQNGGATFGITNVDTPIFPGFAGSPGADPERSLFADDLHVSAVVHRMLGDAAFAAVPEPTSGILAVVGLLSLIGYTGVAGRHRVRLHH